MTRLPVGMRARTTLAYTLLSLLGAVLVSLGMSVTARQFLVEQRQGVSVRQASADARVVAARLRSDTAVVGEALDAVAPRAGTTLLLRRDGRWYSGSASAVDSLVPQSLREEVAAGRPATQWSRSGGQPILAVGIPLPNATQFYEVSVTDELAQTLDTIRWVGAGTSLLVALLGAAFGTFNARRVLRPLEVFANAARSVGAGRLDTRLPETRDPDLAAIVTSFNGMADALDARVRRDARFVADVGHELRSPVTTLATSLEVLERRSAGLPPESAEVVGLVSREVDRLQQTLEDLLELARLDARTANAPRGPVCVPDLVAATLVLTHRDPELLEVRGQRADLVVHAAKERLSRVVVNLLDNADIHGEGLVRVVVDAQGSDVRVTVRDDGPGIPADELETIFERFHRGGRSARRSLPGSGLGLSIARESVELEGGRLMCSSEPNAGTRFVVALPRA